MAVHPQNLTKLRQRVVTAAESILARRKYVAPFEVFVEMQWLPGRSVDMWRQGRTEYLEGVIQANLPKISKALRFLHEWAVARGLRPSETVYLARTRDRRALRFSKSGDADVERAYRTHWVSPELSEAKRERLRERQSRAPELVVIQPLNTEWTCTACKETGDFLVMEDAGPLCVGCADLDHLEFLPAGDAALTRRSVKGSRLHAVVVRFNRARKRYERQGVMVEENALAAAEATCLEDCEARSRQRQREALRRAAEDVVFVDQFTAAIQAGFPRCPASEAQSIAQHACRRNSGRVGRTSAARALLPEPIQLAVAAAVRHAHTDYDDLLANGISRAEARERVRDRVNAVLDAWR